MRFIGGVTQQQYVERTRGLDPARCLAAGIDVGKRSALALIADHRGEVIGGPIPFELNEPGVRFLERSLDEAARARAALSLRVGIETAGHYHRPVMSRLAASRDVVEVGPAMVKAARETQGSAKIKNDLRDCAAILDLVISGMGWSPQQRDEAMTAQLVWATLRARRVKARTALSNQLLGTLDLVFPGLDGCFDDLLTTRVGPILLEYFFDPDQLLALDDSGLGVEALQAFTAGHGVRLLAPKARQLLQAARDALRLPASERACRAEVLGSDVALLRQLSSDVDRAEKRLSELLPATPAAVLTSLPGVGVVRASNYGAALGDPWRFRGHEQAYRIAGMHPSLYDSAGKERPGQRLSRRGKPELRFAIVELGKGLSHFDPVFAAYRQALLDRGMPKLRANIAVGHKAHRLAFSLMRQQTAYDPDRYQQSLTNGGERRLIVTGGPVKKDREAACRHDVTHPSPATLPRHNSTGKTPLVT